MSAKSMASIPRILQPRCSANTFPNATSTKCSSRTLRARTVAMPVVLDAGIRTSSSFNSASYEYGEFMPDLQWSGIGLVGTSDSTTGCVRHPLLAGQLNRQQLAVRYHA